MPIFLTVPKDWQKYCTLYPRKNDLALCSNLSVRHVLGILSCEKFLQTKNFCGRTPIEEKHLFHRSDPAYCTITQAAQYYCKTFWKANVADVAYKRVEEPETGEVISNRAVLNDNNDETDP